MMYSIYKIIRIYTDKVYVGLTRQRPQVRFLQHLSDARNSRGSSLIHKALRRYGREAFEFSIVYECEEWREAMVCERAIIAALGCLAPGGYNLTSGGDGWGGTAMSASSRAAIGHHSRNRSPQTLAKLSARQKGRVTSEETRTKLRVISTGRKHTAESRAKMSAYRKVTHHVFTEEQKRKAAAGRVAKLTGKPLSPEHAAKISASLRGRIVSASTRSKIGAASLGRIPSEETRAKWRVAQKARRESERLARDGTRAPNPVAQQK